MTYELTPYDQETEQTPDTALPASKTRRRHEAIRETNTTDLNTRWEPTEEDWEAAQRAAAGLDRSEPTPRSPGKLPDL